MCTKHTEGMMRFVHGLALVSLLHHCQGFSGGCPFASTAPFSFRQQQPLWRNHAAAGARPRALRWLGLSAALPSPAAASEKSRSFRNTSCAWFHHPRGDHDGGHHQRRQAAPPRRCCSHEDAIWRYRRRPAPPSSSPSSLCAVRGSSSSSSAGSSPGEVEVVEDEGVGGGYLLAAEDDKKAALPTRTRRRKKGDKGKKEQEKDRSVLGKAGDALKVTFNVFMAASTVLSLALAAEAIWQLHGTQLTLSNVVPTLTKLLPLTGIGVFGAAQLVGLVARVVRVIVTLPVMLSGTWVILQNAPKLFPQGSDLGGAGSLAALLATPEVLEAAAVLALLGGTAVWALNFATGAVGWLVSGQRDSSPEEFEDEEEGDDDQLA